MIKMHWTKIPTGRRPSPSKTLHKLAANIEVDNIATDDKINSNAHKSIANDKDFPIQPKSAKHETLPFIAPKEIVERDGKHGARLWIVIDGIVLDLTAFASKHPGGRDILERFGGEEVSWQWWSIHNRRIWEQAAETLRVGRTEGLENKHEKPAKNDSSKAERCAVLELGGNVGRHGR